MDVHSSSYACNCLNVRIFSRSRCSSDSSSSPNNQWLAVDVDDDGVVIIHREFTLRTRSKASPDPKDASRYIQYMSLTCMSCQCLVYRVLQSTSPDSECKEGPILPTEEWVEKEVLKTLSGRLEVHNDCLTQEAIARAESQPSFSKIFRIILPEEAGPLPVVSSQSPPNLLPITAPNLPPLPPIFRPPPFTPSHPAFLHISSVATAESEKIRAAAEEYLANIILNKVREIEDQENQLRRQAEGLWHRFRETLDKSETEKRDMSQKKRDNGKWASRTTSPTKENSGTPISIYDFVPTTVPAPKLNASSGSITPRASALSASLATSSFHHPRENRNSDSSRQMSSSTSAGTVRSLSTASSNTLANQGNQHLEEVNDILEPFRRDMNEAKDVATSLLVLDLEAQMTRREQQRAALEKAKAGSDNQGNLPVGPSSQPQRPLSKPNGMAQLTTPGSDDRSTPTNFVSSPESKKGKRKVTFDVQPDVVTIKRDVTKETDELILQSTREAKRIQVSVFDLEDELHGNGDSDAQPSVELPLLDTTPANRRRYNPRPRSSNAVGLPQSLSSLRPVSLPPPSTDRIPLHTRTSEATVLTDASHVQQPSAECISDESEMDLQPIEVELRKLVAADTPSHRGAWKKGSKAWERFITGRGDGAHEESDKLEEEELDNWNDEYGWSSYKPENVACSLPVTISSQLGKAFGPKSYQVKNSLSDRPGYLVPKLPNNRGTSESSRRAVYAERDRCREMDPGMMDFSTPPDGLGLDGEEQDVVGELYEGRGHQYALRILQARSELPEPGMWRSLV